MSAKMTSFWLRTCETVLLVLAFLLPLAFFLQTYDVTAIKTTIFEIGTVVLAFAWLCKGMERGRWEIPEAAQPLALPALALLAWTILSFTTAPYKIAALPGFLKQVLGLVIYLIALLEFGGVSNARRLFGWITAAAWIAGLYGLCQRLGVDPLAWKGAFGERVFATFGDPESFGLFLTLCIPLTLAQCLDPERDEFLCWLDIGLLGVLLANIALVNSWMTWMAIANTSWIAAVGLPWFFPSRRSLKAAGFSVVLFVLAILALFKGGTKPPAWLHDLFGAYGAMSQLLAHSRWFGVGLGGVLCLWLAIALGAAAWSARRRFVKEGALGESCYVGGLSVAALSCLGSWAYFPHCLMWPFAGMLGGLTVLARHGAYVSVLPLPIREASRRRLYAPALLVMVGLLFFPARWFDSEIENNLALHHARLGEYDQAIAHCDKVFPGAESYVASRLVKGDAYLALNDPQDALKTYAALQQLSPDYGRVNYQQGLAYAKLEDWASAAESYARQTQLEPTSVASYVGWSQAALQIGDLGAAETAAAKAVELEPTEPSHKLALAEVYAQEKRLAQAHRRKINVGKSVNPAPKKPQG